MVRLDGDAVGCGGVALFADFAEIKRMYVSDVARGKGVAQVLLARIGLEARAAGQMMLRLATGKRRRYDCIRARGFGAAQRSGSMPSWRQSPSAPDCSLRNRSQFLRSVAQWSDCAILGGLLRRRAPRNAGWRTCGLCFRWCLSP
jgi:predicted GNAT family acetyltransferase